MTSPSIVLLRTQSDDRLVKLTRDGHERAFEAIVERYRRPLLRACRRVLPEARAEDALQHTLLAAWSALQRGDDVRDLRPWLHRIAHRTSLNQLRMSGYDFDQLQDSLRIADGPQEELERRAVVRQTLRGLAALPERQRQALLAIAVDGRSQDDVAGELGLSQGGVRQLVHRARTNMRAAATAVVPLPLVAWIADATARSEPLAQRIAELSAGAGGAGAAAALAKTGTVIVLAGGAVGTPAVVQHGAGDGSARAAQRSEYRGSAREAPRRRAVPVAAAVVAPLAAPTLAAEEPAARRDEPSRRDAASPRRGAASPPDRSDRRGGAGPDDEEEHDEDGSSGPGTRDRDRDRERETEDTGDQDAERDDDDDLVEPRHDRADSSGPGSETDEDERRDDLSRSASQTEGEDGDGSSGDGEPEPESPEPELPEAELPLEP